MSNSKLIKSLELSRSLMRSQIEALDLDPPFPDSFCILS